jgi:hypothetical protein
MATLLGQNTALLAAMRDKDKAMSEAVRDKDNALASLLAQLFEEKENRRKEQEAGKAEAVAGKDRWAVEAVAAAHLQGALLAKEGELMRLQHKLDLAEGRVSVRSVLEASVDGVWYQAHPEERKKGATKSMSARLGHLLDDSPIGCSGLLAYLRTTALANSVTKDEVVRQARRLYEVLCERVHSEPLGGTTRLPAELFLNSGRPTLLAFAALARFGGRDIALYEFTSKKALELKFPVLRSIKATEAEVAASGILPTEVA